MDIKICYGQIHLKLKQKIPAFFLLLNSFMTQKIADKCKSNKKIHTFRSSGGLAFSFIQCWPNDFISQMSNPENMGFEIGFSVDTFFTDLAIKDIKPHFVIIVFLYYDDFFSRRIFDLFG